MDENVQPEPVSDVEPVSEVAPKVEEPKAEEPKPELTEERVQQLIAEATAKAVTEAKDAGRRELQGEQDRNKSAERRARLAESRVTGYETSFKGLDEETQNSIELAKLRSENQSYQSFEQDEKARRDNDDYFKKLDESLAHQLESVGINRSDERVDWAKDAPDYLTGKARFDTSISKILKENTKVTEKKDADKFAEMEAKLRKDLGLDSVETSIAAGGNSDSKFVEDFNSGALPYNKENKERAEKILGG